MNLQGDRNVPDPNVPKLNMTHVSDLAIISPESLTLIKPASIIIKEGEKHPAFFLVLLPDNLDVVYQRYSPAKGSYMPHVHGKQVTSCGPLLRERSRSRKRRVAAADMDKYHSKVSFQ